MSPAVPVRYKQNDPEYGTWSQHVRYIYDERISILTNGHEVAPTAAMDQIARLQARAAHVDEVSFKASQLRTSIAS